jgi:hypothetical protein
MMRPAIMGGGRIVFCLTEDRRVPLESMTNDRLRRLHEYWNGKRAGRAMPSRADIEPLEMVEHLGRMHLLDVVEPNLFRFRLYGSSVTNPNVKDMTGRTTRDYEDAAFGAVVTRHYQECVEEKAPVYHEVFGTLGEAPYEYVRLTLPLSSDDANVHMLLSSSHRLRVSLHLPSRDLLDG